MGRTPVNHPYQPRQHTRSEWPNWGPKSLVEERDACGVGFLANRQNRASHDLVAKALAALDCMEHRGGCCADQASGDGAGVMTAIPWAVLNRWVAEKGHGVLDSDGQRPALDSDRTGVAMIFLPTHSETAAFVRDTFNQVVKDEGLSVVGWRPVPVNPDVLGPLAKQYQPRIEQLVIASTTETGDDLERRLYLVRRQVLHLIAKAAANPDERAAVSVADLKEFYVCSCSCRTIVYRAWCDRRC
jgi:glutamate synthase (ferredoxin)